MLGRQIVHDRRGVREIADEDAARRARAASTISRRPASATACSSAEPTFAITASSVVIR